MDYSKLAWISFLGPHKPINGQKIYYYGEYIGVCRGRYEIRRDDPVSPHIIICEEERDEEANSVLAKYGLDGITMTVDNMDAPWWMPDLGQPKPPKPDQDYPPEYPK